MKLVTKRIEDMYVQCSLQVRNFSEFATAMSDCCQSHAVTAVINERGDRLWRCQRHYNVLSLMPHLIGPYVPEINVPQD